MSDMDDFFLNDDDLAKDNELNKIDLAKIRLLETISRTANETIQNIRFNEEKDAFDNIDLITNYLAALHRLAETDVEDLGISDEEMDHVIKEAETLTTELTFRNIDTVFPDDNDGKSGPGKDIDTSDASGTDW